jgi:hypothetical protein
MDVNAKPGFTDFAQGAVCNHSRKGFVEVSQMGLVRFPERSPFVTLV